MIKILFIFVAFWCWIPISTPCMISMNWLALVCQRKFILMFGFDAILLIIVPFSVIQLSNKTKSESFLFNNKEVLELNDKKVRDSSTLCAWKLTQNWYDIWPFCDQCQLWVSYCQLFTSLTSKIVNIHWCVWLFYLVPRVGHSCTVWMSFKPSYNYLPWWHDDEKTF